jgi:glycosyltransferase involved in cell wall biosynthesis
MRVFFKKACMVIGISDGVCNGLKKDLGLSADKCCVVNNPVNIDKAQERSRDSIPDNEKEWFSGSYFHFISAGRLTKPKNYPILLKAFSRVIDKMPNCRLTILGDGEKRNTLEKMLNELNIEHEVWLRGFTGNPFKYFKKAHCFVSSSIWEGFGNVIIEAMACGLPIISTMTSGGKEILVDEIGSRYGILVPVDNPECLAQEMLSLATNTDRRKTFAMLSAKRVQCYDVLRIASIYIGVLKRALVEC